MRTLEEILAIPEVERKIYYLKKGRKTELPNAQTLYNDWNPNKHEIVIDEEKYPKIKITTQPAYPQTAARIKQKLLSRHPVSRMGIGK